MSNKIGFARGQGYLGTNADQPPNWAQFTNRPPTQYDNQNVSIGDLWLDTSPTLLTPAEDPAVWVLVGLEGNSTSKGVLAHWIRFISGSGGLATQSFLTDDNNVEVPIGSPAPPPPLPLANGQIKVFGGATVPNVYTNINTAQGADVNTVDVDLNNSIGQPNTTADGSQGVYALGGNNNFILDRFMHNYGTANTFLGNLSGNMALTVANASNNTCLGAGTGPNLVGTGGGQGALNTFIGSSAGFNATNASGNFFGGALSGTLATTASFNTAGGLQSLNNLLTGSNNVSLGYQSGSNYTGAESQNICIGSIGGGGNSGGKVGEVGTIWIGSNPGGATQNIFIGNGAGNTAYTTANNNTIMGTSSGAAITSAIESTFYGNGCGQAITSGSTNSSYGSLSLHMGTTAAANSSCGAASLGSLLTGVNCSALGFNAGGAYVGAESNNICIGAGTAGVAAESNTLRIGLSSGNGAFQLNRAFIQGIYGVNPPGGGVLTVVQDMNGQLGTSAAPVNPFATTGFMATNSTSPANYFTLGAFVTIGLDTIVFDLGANFNTGTSLYTVPSTGYYWFNAMVTLTAVPNTITECTMSFVPSAGPGTFGPMSFNPNLYQAIIAATGMAFGGSWMTFITAGTTVALQVLLGGSGGNTGYVGGQGRTFFQGYRIY